MDSNAFKSFQEIVLGGDSWTLSYIVPGVMGHDNPTKEHSEDPTQIE